MLLCPVNVSKKECDKQWLDEIEHVIMNYQNRGPSYLPKPRAEADNTDTRCDNSWYHAKTEFND